VRAFADTSALFAVVDERDQRHGRAAEGFRALRAQRAELLTHNYVMVELVALIHRRLGKLAAAEAVDRLLAPVEIRWVTPSLHAEAMAAYRESEQDASFVDQMSFAVMRSERLRTAFAFDDDFRRAGFQTIP
jgi:predicted nucleic acid-binding protein